ncbi:hypothetical protein ACC697_03835 [Rhizobium ruizarguesonis]|jgi:hypothetical protein
MRTVFDQVAEPVYIEMSAELTELRGTLAALRSQLSEATGSDPKELEGKIAVIEKKISGLTEKLPSNTR